MSKTKTAADVRRPAEQLRSMYEGLPTAAVDAPALDCWRVLKAWGGAKAKQVVELPDDEISQALVRHGVIERASA